MKKNIFIVANFIFLFSCISLSYYSEDGTFHPREHWSENSRYKIYEIISFDTLYQSRSKQVKIKLADDVIDVSLVIDDKNNLVIKLLNLTLTKTLQTASNGKAYRYEYEKPNIYIVVDNDVESIEAERLSEIQAERYLKEEEEIKKQKLEEIKKREVQEKAEEKKRIQEERRRKHKEAEFLKNTSQKVHDLNAFNVIANLVDLRNVPKESKLHLCVTNKIFDNLTTEDMRRELSRCLYMSTEEELHRNTKLKIRKDGTVEKYLVLSAAICAKFYFNPAEQVFNSILNSCM